MPRVFFSYCHADEGLRDQLEKQLSLLKRQGFIDTWHDRRITAGEDIDLAINTQLNSCEIILLLVSSDFLASNYCYDIEVKRALERHKRGDAIVIPVILRSCLWHDAPFGGLNATPPDGRAVTQWPDRDQAFMEVAKAIQEAAKRFESRIPDSIIPSEKKIIETDGPKFPNVSKARSSNIRIAKKFGDKDRDIFKHETFDYISSFFENSLDELCKRNNGIDKTFRKINSNRFTAAVYRGDKVATRCTIFMSGSTFGNSILYSATETTESNSYNEALQVENDDQMLYLTSLGMWQLGGGMPRDSKLSQEGAAELFWQMFIQPLQSGSA